ncbi:uncharacterized protein N7518_006965 [Penicillium psychrosexuale]|uniref:uncharacterized protein n=1 Tax=Penicillium psychrosexuale TaxID=1002107 RepID=UPI002545BDBE|nr:uncharacterized protein N7518_006965 [Penicillium psychrosexuale]KAJ5789954.1 hypothetical protein N7518_006965 [Penicillium psychrosexuale]
MRSAVIVAALAVGTCARVIEKEVYVTEWTTTTVTETITQWPTSTSTLNTAVLVKQSTKTANAAHPTVDVSRKEVESAPAAASTTTAAGVEAVEPSSATSSTSSSTTSSIVPSSTTEAEIVAVTSSATSVATSSEAPATVAPTTTAAATTSVATSSATSTTAAAATSSSTDSYQESILYYHNIHRSEHSVGDLTWSDDLAGAANTLASRCVYGHDTSIVSASGDYGQNIAYGYDAAEVGEKIISGMMYTDEAPYFANLYGEANPDMTNFEKWGHFTQIVWKATTQVGCATVSCSDLGNVGSAAPYTVCNYGSPGNYAGEYADNVLKPTS